MVATLARAASADYYIHSQASHRPPEEYYLSGEEPDGLWWNPSGLFSDPDSELDNSQVIDSAAFYRLYNGFHPSTGEKLVKLAGKEQRCPGYDMIFNAGKSISALWAIAPNDLRDQIQDAHNRAVRVALEDTVLQHCSNTRLRDEDGNIKVVPADIMAGLFQHGASRSDDPHLHTHCVILNIARTHQDGEWRSLHGAPIYKWPKAAGAIYRAELAWLLHQELGIQLEPYGKDNEYTRIASIPEDLITEWSKRNIQIKDTAARLDLILDGNRALRTAVQRMTRASKQQGVDPDQRHLAWTSAAEEHIEDIDLLVESIVGQAEQITSDQTRKITETLEELPSKMTEMEAVFRYTDVIERTNNAAQGLLSREARKTAVERVLHSPALVQLDRPAPSPDTAAQLAHTRTYTSAHNLETELEIHKLATDLVSTKEFGIDQETVSTKIESLLSENYPLSKEQIDAIEFATAPGRIAIIEGAAGSGKTTTLRPLADLYREEGCNLIGTAVAWRTTVALGNDIDAPNYCVDSLLKRVARGSLQLDNKTVVVVDEAGMLSSAQARLILRLSQDTGAKIIFAGDTQQQQPVTAGPGLRLIKEVTKSARVDTIRRQRADLEDMIAALVGAAPETARLKAGMVSEAEEREIRTRYEALDEERKASIQPWQVTAAEAFRDGETAAAIEAYAQRGRMHIEGDLEKTLTRLVDDWHRYQTKNPDNTTAVLAQTNAEATALSTLMRHRLLGEDNTHRTVIESCRGRDPNAKPQPLEIAQGDRIRIGTTNWDKQLFNGSVVTVDELRTSPSPIDNTERAWIRGRTDEGREVTFWHDEIKDFHGKIRLDHGYALTIASAQGITVDHSFLLTNQKPARETIYPAATRHRDGMDFYIDRKPIELEIREQRPEDEAANAVTDSDIKAHLAGRWSREQPKEAALDFISKDTQERLFAATSRTLDPDGRSAPAWLAANDPGDGSLKAVAATIRDQVLDVAHGPAAERIGDACRQLNTAFQSWEALRATEGNAAIALDPAYQADVARSRETLRKAQPLRTGNTRHTELLWERGGIRLSDIEELEQHQRRATSVHDMARADLAGERLVDELASTARLAPDELVEAIEADLAALAPHHAHDQEAAAQTIDTAHEPPIEAYEDDYNLVAEDDFGQLGELEAHSIDQASWGPIPDPGFPNGSQPIHSSPAIASTPEQEIFPNLDQASEDPRPSPAQPSAPPRPDHENLAAYETFLDRLEHNQATAKQLDLHPSHLPDWSGIMDTARDIRLNLNLPANSHTFLDSLIAADRKWRAQRSLEQPARGQAPDRSAPQTQTPELPPDRHQTPEQTPSPTTRDPSSAGTEVAIHTFEEFQKRLAAHLADAASSRIHPFEAPGWHPLADQATDLVESPGLDHASYIQIAETLSRYDGWAARQSPSPQQTASPHYEPSLAQRSTEDWYTDYRDRIEQLRIHATARNEGLFHQEQWPSLAKEGSDLLRRADLDDIARNHLRRTLQNYEAHSHRQTTEETTHGTKLQPASLSPYASDRRSTPELSAEYRHRIDQHRDRAKETGVPAFQAPGARDLLRDGRQLLRRPDLGQQLRTAITAMLDRYRQWTQRQERRSREEHRSRQPPDKSTSQGMGR